MAQDDYYYEIQLTNKQLVFYFMAGATGLILSFLAGVMVGRGVDAQAGEVQAARGGQEERTISEETPRPPSPAASPAELSYAQRLESEKPDDALGKPQPTASATAVPAPAPASAGRGPSPKPSSSAEAPGVPPPTSVAKEAKAGREAPKAAAQGKAPEPPATPTPAPTRAATREPKAAPAATKPAPASGAFTIQVGAFKDGATAETVVTRLKGKGFAAFVVPPEGDDGLFLVRVGSFAARVDAERTEAKLRDQEKFKPYIVKN